MEHRCSPRKETNSSVLVFHMKKGWIRALVKNISEQGMLICTGRAKLPVGDIVELAGPAAWKLESSMGLPKGFIVHSDGVRMGLMLVTNGGKSPLR